MSTTPDNYVKLQGHLGQEIEIREFDKGRKLAKVSLATNEFKKSSDGTTEKITTWHNLTAWGKLAEDMHSSLQKGNKVVVEGRIAYRQFETKSGEKRYMTEIVLNSFHKVEKEAATEAAS
jgi:single-strand DNA-binding protein